MNITVRPYRGKDEASLLAAWQAALPIDAITAQRFRTQVLLDANFKPEHLLVAEEDGAVRGFVLGVARQVPFFDLGLQPQQAWITAFGVHPQHQRRGIGTRLFDLLEEGLRAERRRLIGISPYVPNYVNPGVDADAYPAALDFLQARGYSVIDHPAAMHMPLSAYRVPAETAALQAELEAQGCTFHALQPADLTDLLPFISRHFGWEWRRHAQEYLVEWLNGSDEVTVWVARCGTEVVGYCQMRRERFGPFGVNPVLRGRGIGQVLLCRCLAEQRSKGFHSAWFLWAEEQVQRLYLRTGFSVMRRWVIFEKELD